MEECHSRSCTWNIDRDLAQSTFVIFTPLTGIDVEVLANLISILLAFTRQNLLPVTTSMLGDLGILLGARGIRFHKYRHGISRNS